MIRKTISRLSRQMNRFDAKVDELLYNYREGATAITAVMVIMLYGGDQTLSQAMQNLGIVFGLTLLGFIAALQAFQIWDSTSFPEYQTQLNMQINTAIVSASVTAVAIYTASFYAII